MHKESFTKFLERNGSIKEVREEWVVESRRYVDELVYSHIELMEMESALIDYFNELKMVVPNDQFDRVSTIMHTKLQAMMKLGHQQSTAFRDLFDAAEGVRRQAIEIFQLISSAEEKR